MSLTRAGFKIWHKKEKKSDLIAKAIGTITQEAAPNRLNPSLN